MAKQHIINNLSKINKSSPVNSFNHNQSSEDKQTNKIVLKDIDITESAKNFSKLLNEKETIFLNGKWGSGKTHFIEKVEKVEKNRKFIKLDLWNIKNNNSLYSVIFQRFFPTEINILYLLIIVLVSISIIATPTINLGLENIFPQWMIRLGIIFSLLVTVSTIFKLNIEHIFWMRLNWTKILCSLKKKKLLL